LDLEQSNLAQGNSRPILEWAFAGTSHTTVGDDENEKGTPRHSVWEHWIDSMSNIPSPDEGDMWLQPNGDVLEQGTQLHPVTGFECKYEELWGDVEINLVDAENKKVSLVMKVDDGDCNARGLVVRVGQYCQGILKLGNELTLERWAWMNPKSPGASESKLSSGEWRCQIKIGDGSLPCDRAIEGVHNGTTIRSGTLEWRVIEEYYW
jgi:hypothetical protein